MASVIDEKAYDALIREKQDSAGWDLAIARGVLRRRRVTRIRAAAASAAATALAAAVVFAILPGPGRDAAEGEKLDSLVSAQVNGTWSSAIAASNGTPASDEADLGAEMDDLIDETMTRRL